MIKKAIFFSKEFDLDLDEEKFKEVYSIIKDYSYIRNQLIKIFHKNTEITMGAFRYQCKRFYWHGTNPFFKNPNAVTRCFTKHEYSDFFTEIITAIESSRKNPSHFNPPMLKSLFACEGVTYKKNFKIDFSNNTIDLSKIKNIKFKNNENISLCPAYKVKLVNTFSKNFKIQVFSVKTVDEITPSREIHCVAMDLGYRNTATFSDGKIFSYDSKKEAELLTEFYDIKETLNQNSLLDRKEFFANETLVNLKLKSEHNLYVVREMKKKFLKDLVNYTKNFNLIFYEKNIFSDLQNNFGKQINEDSILPKNKIYIIKKFHEKFKKVAENHKIITVEVRKEFTSLTCSNCRQRNIENRVKFDESFKCLDCGFEINADINAAINIKRRGLHQLKLLHEKNITKTVKNKPKKIVKDTSKSRPIIKIQIIDKFHKEINEKLFKRVKIKVVDSSLLKDGLDITGHEETFCAEGKWVENFNVGDIFFITIKINKNDSLNTIKLSTPALLTQSQLKKIGL